jgi:hypothetical protein
LFTALIEIVIHYLPNFETKIKAMNLTVKAGGFETNRRKH